MNFVNWFFLVNQKHVVQYSLIPKTTDADESILLSESNKYNFET